MATINVALCLQGGGSATAWQAGALIPFLENPHLHIKAITGTSGGAFNGGVLKSVFTQHGQAVDGRKEAISQLKNAWINHLAAPDMAAHWVSWHEIFNPVGHVLATKASRGLFTSALEHTLSSVIPNDAVLQSPNSPTFYVQTVDETTGQGRLHFGNNLTRRNILASAALKDCFDSVDGEVDGAYLGGANPPAPPSDILNKVNCVLYFTTAAEPKTVQAKWQRDLTAEDLEGEETISEQAHWEIECLRRQGHNVIVIAPEKSFENKDKGIKGRTTIKQRIEGGQSKGRQVHNATFKIRQPA